MISAVTMVKDEEDIIVPVILQLFAQGVDHVWVADNMSSDKTRPLLEDLAVRHPLTIVDDDEPGYYQAQKMTDLAHRAIDDGADWVVPFDADEWFYGEDRPLADILDDIDADVVYATGWDHVPRLGDPDDDNPIRRMGWRRPYGQTYPKVMFRATPWFFLHQGNHDIEHPGRKAHGPVRYRHFGYRSLPQMIRKVRQGAAAYAASNVHPAHGTHWKDLAALSDDELAVRWENLRIEGEAVYDPAPMP